MANLQVSVPTKKIKETTSVVVTKSGRYTLTYTNKSHETWEITIEKEN